MKQTTAKVVRVTGSGVAVDGIANVSAVQVIGGTAATSLYDGTGVVAADLKLQVTGGDPITILENPIRFSSLYVDAGVGATDILLHIV